MRKLLLMLLLLPIDCLAFSRYETTGAEIALLVMIIVLAFASFLISCLAILSFLSDKYKRTKLHWVNVFSSLPLIFITQFRGLMPAYSYWQRLLYFIPVVSFIVSVIHLVAYRKKAVSVAEESSE